MRFTRFIPLLAAVLLLETFLVAPASASVPQPRFRPSTVLRPRRAGAQRVRAILRSVNPMRGQNNCGGAAIALDRSLAGTPAVALPIGGMTPRQMETALGTELQITTVRSVERRLRILGKGARAILFAWKGKRGHFFNVVNEEGVVRFLDGQNAVQLSRSDVAQMGDLAIFYTTPAPAHQE